MDVVVHHDGGVEVVSLSPSADYADLQTAIGEALGAAADELLLFLPGRRRLDQDDDLSEVLSGGTELHVDRRLASTMRQLHEWGVRVPSPPTPLTALLAAVEYGAVAAALHLAEACSPSELGKGLAAALRRRSKGTEMASALLLCGAGLDWEDAAELCAEELCPAAALGREALAEHLLGHGVSPFGTDAQLQTPLHHAARMCSAEGLCRTLLEHGADPLARDKQGMTPLHHAAQRGTPDACAMLLRAAMKVDGRRAVDVAADDGTTPLMCAMKYQSRPCVKLLLSAGATTPQDRLPATCKQETGVWRGRSRPLIHKRSSSIA